MTHFKIVSLLILSLPIFATETLKLEDVLKQTRTQAPKVLASLEKVISAEEKVRAARGAFDTNFNGEYYQRREGYYPGKHYEGRIEKPIPFGSAKVYGGFRKSEGKFPTYEGDRLTLNDGEIMAGLSFNLLRNFNIDKKRLKLGLSRFDLEKEQWKNKEIMMKLQKEASISYWAWVAAGHMLTVAEDLLNLSENRQIGFEKRIKRGDLAALYSVENRQYIVKRKSKVQKALADFKMASLYLSLYWRDKEGNPLLPQRSQLPKLIEMESSSIKNKNVKVDDLIKASFSLKSLGADIKAIEKEQEFYDSRFMPEVKIKYEVLRDRGDGSSSLQGTDHKVVVGVNIPIERNLIKGNLASTKAKKRILGHERRLLEDTLMVEINQLRAKLDASLEIMKNSRQEVDLGRKLEEGEKKKFSSGASDFFVVNIREQNTFDARLRQIEALFSYQETLSKYRELLMDFSISE